ncbi:MAG: RecQ family ATP-dependent DNA helicase [Bacteroidales bacterium]|nr:RecQ family ATP-dependent DNA helicase [Bacteroidales bacterium]
MKDPESVLREYWGYDSFRPRQREIIDSVLAGHDTLGLLPTGGGKSLTFQVPAMMLDGLTVVITPLISLMKDQVDNLRERGIRAVYLTMGMTRRETRLVYDKCRLGKTRLLYVSPERLRSESFVRELRGWNVSLITVDEAHCISQWGYDFRPSYLRIGELRGLLGPDVPVLALTASATPLVRDDIARQLRFRPDSNVYALSFDRPNLSYVARITQNKTDKLLQVLGATTGTAIVYVRSRKKTREIAELLQGAGISATFYHAGLDPEVKAERQEQWKSGRTRVIVATNAFGMGIDKPDVRTVVHIDLPPSLEEYYQEAGRAGRDGLPSFAVLIATTHDRGLLKRRLNEAFPPVDFVRRVYELIGAFLDVPVGGGYNKVFEFDLARFCRTYGLQERMTRGALALLTQAAYIEFQDEAPTRARLMMLCRRDELYAERLTAEEDAVLMAVLRTYTGLFSEYAFVSESEIARVAQLPEQSIYDIMLALGRKNILHYIPRKSVPYILYVTGREETRHVCLGPEIYENRRKLMEERLNAVADFAYTTERCRSVVLLEYFGEKDVSDCGRCDICRSRAKRLGQSGARTQAPADDDRRVVDDIPAAILRLLRSGRLPASTVAQVLCVGAEELAGYVRDLSDRRLIRADGLYLELIKE